MSLNALMKISKADGECKQAHFENWIEIQSWDWDVEAETSWTKGGGCSVGKPNPGKLNFEHYWDKS
jgi:type VI secretion system secreted protein Hcp